MGNVSHHGDKASNEAEVGEVVRVYGRGGVYLQTVVIFTGVLKQTVHRVQHLMGQQEEPLPVETDRRRETQTETARQGRCQQTGRDRQI